MNPRIQESVELWSAGLRDRLHGPLSLDACPMQPRRRTAIVCSHTAKFSPRPPTPDSFLEFIPLPAVAQPAPADDPPASINEPEPSWHPL